MLTNNKVEEIELTTLKEKTLFITGASRGIGLAIALRAARDGANVAVAAKTDKPHPKLPGTIHSAAEEIEAAGGKALALVCDIREPAQLSEAVDTAAEHFGGIDICVNNASAIQLTGTAETPIRRFDLMHQVNARGTFLTMQTCLPYLEQAENPHVLMLSPPLDMNAKWFAPNVAYTMAKFGMSLCVLGMAEEFRDAGIAVNALWPRTTIATAAIQNLLGGDEIMRKSRTPDIIADAAWHILTSPSREMTGNFFIDDTFLAERGETDFDKYRIDPSQELMQDFFVPDDSPAPASLGPAV
ncbi:MAG: NAD(P)-dependent oxidoreductase [Pseudomonadota bacterium]